MRRQTIAPMIRALRQIAAATAIGFALVMAPVALSIDTGLDYSSAAAKSEKSNNKKDKKDKKDSKASDRSNDRASNGGGGKSGGSKSASVDRKSIAGGAKKNHAVLKPEKTRGPDAAHTLAKATKGPKAKSNAVVRQYVLANGLKQGDVAKLLKSWNSLNRNAQAYLNNLDNPNSLPGLQLAYIREGMNAESSLTAFTDLGGDPTNPPTQADLDAAQSVLDAQTVLDAEKVLDAQDTLDAQAVLDAQSLLTDAETAEAGTYTQEEIDAATALVGSFSGEDPQAVVDSYSGDDPQSVVDSYEGDDPKTVVESYEGDPRTVVDAYEGDPQLVVDQYDAWGEYDAAQTSAQDAFMAASVSYSGDYDEATMGEVRGHVDAIVAMTELSTIVADYDATLEEDTESTSETALAE